jgi:hypothetical protein
MEKCVREFHHLVTTETTGSMCMLKCTNAQAMSDCPCNAADCPTTTLHGLCSCRQSLHGLCSCNITWLVLLQTIWSRNKHSKTSKRLTQAALAGFKLDFVAC